MSEIKGKEVAEAALVAYYDYVMRFELNAMIPKIREHLEANPEADVAALVKELMANFNTHISEDYRVASLKVMNDLGARIGEVAQNL